MREREEEWKREQNEISNTQPEDSFDSDNRQPFHVTTRDTGDTTPDNQQGTACWENLCVACQVPGAVCLELPVILVGRSKRGKTAPEGTTLRPDVSSQAGSGSTCVGASPQVGSRECSRGARGQRRERERDRERERERERRRKGEREREKKKRGTERQRESEQEREREREKRKIKRVSNGTRFCGAS